MLTNEALLPSPAPRRAADRSSYEPGLAVRALAHARWFSLDGRLAAGEDPAGSRLLAAQAARLTAPRHREMLAAALEGMLVAAEEGPRNSRAAPSRAALMRNEAAVRALARRVDSRETLYARGLARLERLLSDSTGPAFHGGVDALSVQLGRVESELSGQAAPEPPGGARSSRERSLWRLARPRMRRARPMTPRPGFAGDSFALPDGSWFHGRREGA